MEFVFALDCGLHAAAWTLMDATNFDSLEFGAIDFAPGMTAPAMQDLAFAINDKLPTPKKTANCKILIENQSAVRKPNPYCVAVQHMATQFYIMKGYSVSIIAPSIKFMHARKLADRRVIARTAYTGAKEKISSYQINKYYAKAQFLEYVKAKYGCENHREFCKGRGLPVGAFGDIADSYLLAYGYCITDAQ